MSTIQKYIELYKAASALIRKQGATFTGTDEYQELVRTVLACGEEPVVYQELLKVHQSAKILLAEGPPADWEGVLVSNLDTAVQNADQAMGSFDLGVFKMGPDTVVAKDVEDAWLVMLSHYDGHRSDFGEDDDWEQYPPNKELTVWNFDVDSGTCECKKWKLPDLKGKDTFPNGHHKSCIHGSDRMTCEAWSIKNGRGFLCSEEY